jgi:hypothetical protein
MKGDLTFELLVLDTDLQSDIKSEANLLYSFCSNGSLWGDSNVKPDGRKVATAHGCITVQQVNTGNEADDNSRVFQIKVEGKYEWLESKRLIVLEFLRKQGFEHLYVLSDDVSDEIANELYPLIYKVENLLRGYIVKFMTTRIGSRWWEVTATNELLKKAQQRKNNEREFSKHIDNKVYLIDFGELGEIIYSHSSGFTSKEDILKKINELDETPEAIRTFKEQLKSNYQKFFKEAFSDRNFQEKWERLEKIRHKVAHNNLFTHSDREEGKQTSNDLIELINKAAEGMESVTLREEEKEAIRVSLYSQAYYDDITEDEFLNELDKSEDYFSRFPDGFVGISSFVNHLRGKGYDPYTTREIIDSLENKGKVEIYERDNIEGRENAVAAIRSLAKRAA